MAVLSISANVQLLTASGTPSKEVAGETIAANDALFRVTSSSTGTVGTVKKLINTSQEGATFYGFALAASKNGGDVAVLKSGSFEMDSSTFSAGETYVASATAGQLQPVSDLSAADHFGVVGHSYENDQFVISAQYIGLVA